MKLDPFRGGLNYALKTTRPHVDRRAFSSGFFSTFSGRQGGLLGASAGVTATFAPSLDWSVQGLVWCGRMGVSLPEEVVVGLLGFLPLVDCVSTARTSRVLRKLLGPKDDHLVLSRLLSNSRLAVPPWSQAEDWRAVLGSFLRNRNDDVLSRRLYRALIKGRLAEAEALALAGGDLNWRVPREEGHWSPLHHASTVDNFLVVEWLLKHAVNLNTRDVSGCTPLVQASHNGHERVVAALLGEGARVNDVDDQGKTALWYASWYGRLAIVIMLQAWGADFRLASHEGQTARDIAALNPLDRSGCTEVARFLRELEEGVS